MKYLYTAKESFYKGDEGWEGYIKFSKLNHLTELVSIDNLLSPPIVEPVYENKKDWEFIHIINQCETGFYLTLDYVLKRLETKDKFNLLTLCVNPSEDCKNIGIDRFEFEGYDLLDQDYDISALTNCGGFDESFTSSDINEKGLIFDFTRAYDIRKSLLENNPLEHHADTNVIAIWRHKTIGR